MKKIWLLSLAALASASVCEAKDFRIDTGDADCNAYLYNSPYSVSLNGVMRQIHIPDYRYDDASSGWFKKGQAVYAADLSQLSALQGIFSPYVSDLNHNEFKIILNFNASVQCGETTYLKNQDGKVAGCLPGTCYSEITGDGDQVKDITVNLAYRRDDNDLIRAAQDQGICLLSTIAVAHGFVGLWGRNDVGENLQVDARETMPPTWSVRPFATYVKCAGKARWVIQRKS